MTTLVRITKIAQVAGGAVPASWDEFTPGQQPPEGCSLPSDYVIDGFIIEQLMPGRPIQLLRLEHNGVAAVGLFTSTEVVEVRFKTQNSEFVLTEVRLGGAL